MRDQATGSDSASPSKPAVRVTANRHMLASGDTTAMKCLLGKDEEALCSKKLVPNPSANGRAWYQPRRIR